MKRAMTVDELAERWSCNEMTVRRLIWSGRLRAFRIGSRGVRVPMDEIERWERDQGMATRGHASNGDGSAGNLLAEIEAMDRISSALERLDGYQDAIDRVLRWANRKYLRR